MINFAIRLFPIWVLLFSVFGYLQPGLFTPLKSAIVPMLVVVMFSMGLTLSIGDYKRVLSRPKWILLGVLLQYTVMPLAAWLLAVLFSLPQELMIGMVLVGATAGGTASNVMTYLAGGDLALSISLTLCSTLLAVVLMPWLTWIYIGQQVPVPAMDMLLKLVKIVLIPVVLGSLINHYLHARIQDLVRYLPLVSITAIALIIAVIIALNHDKISSIGLALMLAVALHNLTGMTAGYSCAWVLSRDSILARTVAIEVGMQNSGLSVALALQFYSAMAALPGAVFSVWHNLSGAVYASWWRRRDEMKPADEAGSMGPESNN